MQVFGQERSDDHAGAVVHKPSRFELAHSCINQRKPSFSIAPGLPAGFIFKPLKRLKSLLKRLLCVAGEKQHDVRVEVAPTDLPAEAFSTLPTNLNRALFNFPRADRTKVQVVRQSGSAGGHVIVQILVAVNVAREPLLQARAGDFFTNCKRYGQQPFEVQFLDGWDPAALYFG